MYSPTHPHPEQYPFTYLQNSPLANHYYNYPRPHPFHNSQQYYPYPYPQVPNQAHNSIQPPIIPTLYSNKSTGELNRGVIGSPPPPLIKQQKGFVYGSFNAQNAASIQAGSRQMEIQKGYSRMEYFPYQSYYIDYQQKQFVQNVIVPVEKTVRDYYKVEHVVDYVPQEYQETVIQMVPEQKTLFKVEYLPVEAQVIHFPQDKPRVAQQTKQKTIVREMPLPTIPNNQQKIISHQKKEEIINLNPVQVNKIQTTEIKPFSTKQQVVNKQQIYNQVQTISIEPPNSQRNIIQQPIVRQQIFVSPPPAQTVANQYNQIQKKQAIQQVKAVVQPKPIQTQINNIPPHQHNRQKLPPGYFLQSQQILSQNSAQIQKKIQIPQNVKVNYQYSTRTVRNLSPEQMRQRGLSPRVVSLPKNQNTSPILRTEPKIQQKTTTNVLMKNQEVDLTDSQHIDITKSKYNAFYVTGNNFGSNQTNNNSVLNSGNNFSFGNPASSINNSGGFGPIPELQGERMSGGSVHDYDQYKQY